MLNCERNVIEIPKMCRDHTCTVITEGQYQSFAQQRNGIHACMTVNKLGMQMKGSKCQKFYVALNLLLMFHVVTEQMQAGEPVVGAPIAVAGAQSRSEDEESLGVKDIKRTATQAFGSGVPKRRSSSRFDSYRFIGMSVKILTLHFNAGK